ncbi:Fe(2+) transporter permease subunit FeoB [Neisseria sp. Ec49-e6-T10]|uniref:Fe(2+) transporter permease subunit FeoB n=1 Tax=Neisseria sp. Ec49-e6-T10 TaxID=3140744 RepID=UPI003EBE51FD
MSKHIKISLIGNPNCGKTTLFNALTGAKQRVGNWPGVTVEKKTGSLKFKEHKIEVVDLPGTYAIESMQKDVSQDELVVRNYVLSDEETLLVNIVDASNLQRNLYLTFQLLDLNRPMIVVLNMIDVAQKEGIHIDVDALQNQLGCPVLPVSASRKKGIEQLCQSIIEHHKTKPNQQTLTLGIEQETIINHFLQELPQDSQIRQLSRWMLIELILGEQNQILLTKEEQEKLQACQEQLASGYYGEIDIALAGARYDAIDNLTKAVLKKEREASQRLTNFLDRWALGRITGIPVFLIMMYLMFLLAINFGSAFIDFFDILFGTIFVEGTTHLLQSMNAPAWLISIMANGLGAGIQTVATFIPVIAAMFLCLSFLEDSGYMARAAMVVDRGMRAIGLPGKAFVPMLVGFGCNVPAIMGTRTLESNRDRLMSIMMIPYMSCGARLPVYALFAAVFFPKNGQNVVFGLYILGIFVAVLTGFALKYSILKGKNTPFIMELPPYHLPTIKGLYLLSWERLKSFIIRAGKAIVLMVTVLSIFNSLGTDGSFGNENTEKSVLSTVGRQISPVFSPMGLHEDNWPATVGIFTGVFAKEAVIGTLNSLYAQLGSEKEEEEAAPFSLINGVKEAFATIPANIADVFSHLADPMGISKNMADGDIEVVKEENAVNDHAITQIQLAFGSISAAVAYLIFILLYTPCAAALGAVYREAGSKWALMVATWSFVMAWIFATAYYQMSLLGTAASTSASMWLLGLLVMMIILFAILRAFGKKELGLSDSVTNRPITSDEQNGGCCS